MFRYLSLTGEERRRMLALLGCASVEELFASIPSEIRLREPLAVPGPLSESEVLAFFSGLARQNFHAEAQGCFLGAGAYNHFVPAVVDALISRSEFYTAYTPYQAEISQGTLQSIFEFQTLVCQLTGMDVANASLYDGSTALAEAVLAARRVQQRGRLVLSGLVHPQYREVLSTYTRHLDLHTDVIAGTPDGGTDLDAAAARLGKDTAALVLQHPNFLGYLEDLPRAAELARAHGAMLVVAVTEPVALGLLEPPGTLGADICAGEGQALGLPLSFGGPYVGFFSARDALQRHMPGRIVGQTVDAAGRRAYVLTLAAREQHIRREKATSNICTNEGLCALAATVFMCTLGKEGLRELALQNFSKAHYAAAELERHGCSVVFGHRFFNEFVVRVPGGAARLNARLAEEGIIGGYDLSGDFPALSGHMLVCVTEQNSRRQIDRLVELASG